MTSPSSRCSSTTSAAATTTARKSYVERALLPAAFDSGSRRVPHFSRVVCAKACPERSRRVGFLTFKGTLLQSSQCYLGFPCQLAASFPGVRCTMKRIYASLRPLSALLLAVLVLPGCNALNPLCGSARPSPSITSLSADTITFAQVQAGFVLTVNGSHLLASSVVLINGTTVPTLVLSSQQVEVTITTTQITAPGTASVVVNTPGGNSSALGCTSGGTSHTLTLTIT